jgi:phosphatidylserine decarboxylase
MGNGLVVRLRYRYTSSSIKRFLAPVGRRMAVAYSPDLKQWESLGGSLPSDLKYNYRINTHNYERPTLIPACQYQVC